MIKVKICGITNPEDAFAAEAAGADAVGFIFTKKSSRYIKPEEAQRIISGLGPYIVKAGVFMDEPQGEALDIASSLKLDVLQFHGNETPAYCGFFRPRFKVVKVFFPVSGDDLEKQVKPFKVDAFMFDVRLSDKQKGIERLSDSALKQIKNLIKTGRKIIISGGLNAKNIRKVIKLNPYAVDVAGGLEKMVGKKDEELVRQFIAAAKNAVI